VRGVWVAATPEELVRQKVIAYLIGELRFPKSLISVEEGTALSGRRSDLVAYMKQEAELLPLLLVECKAKKCSEKALRQLLGYNETWRAPFVALVAAQEWCIYSVASGALPTLPPYETLVATICLKQ
jgi:hypothetical protein